RLRSTLVPPHRRDPDAARRGADRGRLQAPRPRRHHHHRCRLRPPQRGGRPQVAGGSRLVQRPRGATVSEPIPLLPERSPRPGRRRRTPRQNSSWDTQYGNDVWQLRELGIQDRQLARISFEGIPQSWLKTLAKRWARWRLASSLGAVSVSTGNRAITWFGQFLTDA